MYYARAGLQLAWAMKFMNVFVSCWNLIIKRKSPRNHLIGLLPVIRRVRNRNLSLCGCYLCRLNQAELLPTFYE